MLPVAWLVPVTVIEPVAVIASVVNTTPSLTPVAPEGTVPLRLSGPLPMEIAPPFILIPFELPVLAEEEVPIRVTTAEPVVLRVPPLREIP